MNLEMVPPREGLTTHLAFEILRLVVAVDVSHEVVITRKGKAANVATKWTFGNMTELIKFSRGTFHVIIFICHTISCNVVVVVVIIVMMVVVVVVAMFKLIGSLDRFSRICEIKNFVSKNFLFF